MSPLAPPRSPYSEHCAPPRCRSAPTMPRIEGDALLPGLQPALQPLRLRRRRILARKAGSGEAAKKWAPRCQGARVCFGEDKSYRNNQLRGSFLHYGIKMFVTCRRASAAKKPPSPAKKKGGLNYAVQGITSEDNPGRHPGRAPNALAPLLVRMRAHTADTPLCRAGRSRASASVIGQTSSTARVGRIRGR